MIWAAVVGLLAGWLIHAGWRGLEPAVLPDLSTSRLVDLEAAYWRTWQVLGYRVIRGGALVADSEDISGRRIMGGHEIKLWLAAPEPKRARPIMIERKEAQA